jgi:metal-responsive CopG/Arc/MetJ family transcriptional regulator
MKAIQITVDEALLRLMDEDPEVKQLGRSAVFRRAVAEYLRARRRERTDAAYRQAYGNGSAVREELGAWADEGVWPGP